MKHFWALFWGVAVGVGLLWVLGSCGLDGWIQAAIIAGAVLGVVHVIYDYEEIACTCDDPDHEH